jgi:hypothetical protein
VSGLDIGGLDIPAGAVLAVFQRVRLDWSDPSHWSDDLASCRRCGTPTHGRDRDDAIHLSCAKAERAEEILGHRTDRLGHDLIDERFGLAAGRPLADDLTGHPVPLAPEVRR